MIKHYLHEVNLEHKVAFCSICGPTEIYVSQSREGKKPQVICLNRLRESQAAAKEHRNELLHQRQGWKPRHSLSEIDSEKMTAICSICGPTQIRKYVGKRYTNYKCANKERLRGRNYRRNAYTSRNSYPLQHSLSEINEANKTAVCSICGHVEIYVWQGKRKMGRRCRNAPVKRVPGAQKIRREININIINRFKIAHGCKHCGFKANINKLYLNHRNAEKRDPKIEKLLKLNHEDLMRELGDCEVLCADCRRLISSEFASQKLVPISSY